MKTLFRSGIGFISASTTTPAVLKWIEQSDRKGTLSSVITSVSKPTRMGHWSLKPWAGSVKRNPTRAMVTEPTQSGSPSSGPQPSGDVSLHPGESFLRPEGSPSRAYSFRGIQFMSWLAHPTWHGPFAARAYPRNMITSLAPACRGSFLPPPEVYWRSSSH